MTLTNIVHVAVAVIKNQHGQYFIAQRAKNAHQGGLWEFPGGKVENDESVLEALKRELFEEIGIALIHATPLIQIHHDYHDKSVLLDVWSVDEFTGEAFGKEEQKTAWIKQDDFPLYNFPAANLPIIKALQLPDKYMITGKFHTENELMLHIQSGLKKGIKLVQFRASDLTEGIYFEYAKKIHALCEKKHAKLLLNTSINNYKKYQAHKYSHGIHLTAKELKLFSSTELPDNLLIATSTHNKEELLFAEKNKIDFAVLSPINKTSTHPDSIPLGWDKFKALTDIINIPVYALGGMTENDLITAKSNGGHGISAIGAFWNIL